MNRKPPIDVIRQLRSEVGFGCPVPDCGNPYLEWHHFDPPWCIEQHHNPEGMVALCAEHHKKADNGAYTKDQLAAFKKSKTSPERVRGRFDWRRNKLLAVVGGNFYYETYRIVVLDGHEIVAVSRDEEGCLLLNAQMLSLSRDERVVMVGNCWENIGTPTDLVSPPSGKQLSITYGNGDHLSVEFSVLENADELQVRFQRDINVALEFPLTVVEVNMRIGGTDIVLMQQGTAINRNQFTSNVFAYCGAGLVINLGLKWRQNWCLIPDPGSRLSPCPCGSGRRYKHCHGSLEATFALDLHARSQPPELFGLRR